ncbi:MAG: hypothetical protein FD141_30 [Fusobacteria bacterium]|nr:MAG: hypothetical protein FD141_30 [Fusobacteriota bacterium]KAF0229306.1 MAG: hypothetical protein FD182_1562 [Fusobacteriota bacterium]
MFSVSGDTYLYKSFNLLTKKYRIPTKIVGNTTKLILFVLTWSWIVMKNGGIYI